MAASFTVVRGRSRTAVLARAMVAATAGSALGAWLRADPAGWPFDVAVVTFGLIIGLSSLWSP